MRRLFGDPIDDMGPINFLLEHGWTAHAFLWSKPGATSTNITKDEANCLAFLADEWDHDYYFEGDK